MVEDALNNLVTGADPSFDGEWILLVVALVALIAAAVAFAHVKKANTKAVQVTGQTAIYSPSDTVF